MGLTKYERYTRAEANAILEPDRPFTPHAGTWGILGVIKLPEPKNYAFLVTLGSKQAGHVFQEGISEDGILTWQSQPSNDYTTPQIQDFIHHKSNENQIHLFFRTNDKVPFYYLGELDYINHNPETEKPVWFQWKILDWDPPAEVRSACVSPQIPKFYRTKNKQKGKKRNIDFSGRQRRNEEIGDLGEEIALQLEQEALTAAGRPDLAAEVCSTKERLGNAAAYDIDSFFPDEDRRRKYIEVKTTTGGPAMEFYMSSSERAFAQAHADDYCLYRIFNLDLETGDYEYMILDNLEEICDFEPIQHRVKMKLERDES